MTPARSGNVALGALAKMMAKVMTCVLLGCAASAPETAASPKGGEVAAHATSPQASAPSEPLVSRKPTEPAETAEPVEPVEPVKPVNTAETARGVDTATGLGHPNGLEGVSATRGPGSPPSEGRPRAELRLGTLDVDGDLAPEAVNRALLARVATLRACYTKSLIKHPKLAGAATLQWKIDGDGRVFGANIVKTTLAEPELEQCLTATVTRVTFPPNRTPGASTFVRAAPMTFTVFDPAKP